jgi:hypothetical protein
MSVIKSTEFKEQSCSKKKWDGKCWAHPSKNSRGAISGRAVHKLYFFNLILLCLFNPCKQNRTIVNSGFLSYILFSYEISFLFFLFCHMGDEEDFFYFFLKNGSKWVKIPYISELLVV